MIDLSQLLAKSINLSPDFKQYLSTCRRKTFKQHEPILYQSEVPRHGYYLKRGVVKSYDISKNGDEKIVYLNSPGEFIPPEWVFYKSSVSLYYCSAFTDCEVYIIDRDVIQKLINTDTLLTKKLFNRYIGLYVGAVQQVNALEQSKSANKILYSAHSLIRKFGKSIDKDKMLIDLRLTHQDIASMTGLTRETTSVELNHLKRQGVISYKDQHYTINMKKLQALFGSDDFIKLKN